MEACSSGKRRGFESDVGLFGAGASPFFCAVVGIDDTLPSVNFSVTQLIVFTAFSHPAVSFQLKSYTCSSKAFGVPTQVTIAKEEIRGQVRLSRTALVVFFFPPLHGCGHFSLLRPSCITDKTEQVTRFCLRNLRFLRGYDRNRQLSGQLQQPRWDIREFLLIENLQQLLP